MSNQPTVAVDTSVAVSLLISAHETHHEVARWAQGRVLGLAGHALAETYSVLTRLPADSRVAAVDAVRLIDDNFGECLALPADRMSDVHRELAGLGIAGGATYDGLVALAAREHGLALATRDARARSTYELVGLDVELAGLR